MFTAFASPVVSAVETGVASMDCNGGVCGPPICTHMEGDADISGVTELIGSIHDGDGRGKDVVVVSGTGAGDMDSDTEGMTMGIGDGVVEERGIIVGTVVSKGMPGVAEGVHDATAMIVDPGGSGIITV